MAAQSLIAGHLQEKKGYLYIVLNYNDEYGRRKTKWQSTGLTVKGNKKKAEALLMEARQNFVEPAIVTSSDILFADYMLHWLEIAKSTIELTTYSSYQNSVQNIIVPYFRKKKLRLSELTAKDIQEFYIEQLKRVSASSVIHYHANIHKALKYAVKMDMINYNPADKVERPKREKFTGGFYSSEEINRLIESTSGTALELAVLFGSFYGLRRSEIVGLKWDAIDFKNNTLIIRHIVTTCNIDGKSTTVAKDRTKTKSSLRTLPLVPVFREKLLAIKEKQEANQALCKRSYNKKYLDYIYVDELGELIKPGYITTTFPKHLDKQNMRKIRFHDLRHSCASLLLANGVPMKQIQEWLGHSDFSTTANIYAHLDFNSKISSANAMTQCIQIPAI